MSAYLASYSLSCQPVDYSNDPLAIRVSSSLLIRNLVHSGCSVQLDFGFFLPYFWMLSNCDGSNIEKFALNLRLLKRFIFCLSHQIHLGTLHIFLGGIP